MTIFEQAAHKYFDTLVAKGEFAESERDEWIESYFKAVADPKNNWLLKARKRMLPLTHGEKS